MSDKDLQALARAGCGANLVVLSLQGQNYASPVSRCLLRDRLLAPLRSLHGRHVQKNAGLQGGVTDTGVQALVAAGCGKLLKSLSLVGQFFSLAPCSSPSLDIFTAAERECWDHSSGKGPHRLQHPRTGKGRLRQEIEIAAPVLWATLGLLSFFCCCPLLFFSRYFSFLKQSRTCRPGCGCDGRECSCTGGGRMRHEPHMGGPGG